MPDEQAEGLKRARRLGRAAKPARIEAQRELLTEAIVQAAAEKGYEACGVDDMLARSGLSRSTFYKHFADKEQCERRPQTERSPGRGSKPASMRSSGGWPQTPQ